MTNTTKPSFVRRNWVMLQGHREMPLGLLADDGDAGHHDIDQIVIEDSLNPPAVATGRKAN
jgi:hypothetical protein